MPIAAVSRWFQNHIRLSRTASFTSAFHRSGRESIAPPGGDATNHEHVGPISTRTTRVRVRRVCACTLPARYYQSSADQLTSRSVWRRRRRRRRLRRHVRVCVAAGFGRRADSGDVGRGGARDGTRGLTMDTDATMTTTTTTATATMSSTTRLVPVYSFTLCRYLEPDSDPMLENNIAMKVSTLD